MHSTLKKIFLYSSFFLSLSFFSLSHNEVKESFVIKKKKKNKCGRKPKEQACHAFVQGIELAADLIGSASAFQKQALEKTAQYVDGDDPFGTNKQAVQTLEQKTQELNDLFVQTKQKCDECIACSKQLKKI